MNATAGTLQDRYADVRGRILDAAQRSGRSGDQILLVAVTKYAEPEQIKQLLTLGQRDFAENHVQQLVQRAALLDEHLQRLSVLPETLRRGARESDMLPDEPDRHAPIRWHMIGHLQRNKARKIFDCTRLVHSVDSLRIAEELQQVGLKRDRVMEVLIQVDCAGEETKYGCPLPAAFPLAEQIDTMVHVRVRGLMTMAPYSENPEDARPVFARCRELFEEMKLAGLGDGRFNILSMGMSGDYEVAIEEGSNLVRVGSAIFGPRDPSAEPEPEEA